jgi:outer membrane lipoprotein-sorting protein
MRRLRTASARHLTAIVAIAAALALTAGIAQGALTGSGPVPGPKALANAILDAFDAPEADGLTAKIHFTNNLLPSGSLPGGMASPLASGADGRLWVRKNGDLRLELQSDAGDAQIVAVGNTVTVYDASTNTAYRATLPDDAKDMTRPQREEHGKLTLAKVQDALDRLARTWTVSGAEPTSTAGRPTYTVKVSPKDDGGLLGAAELAWDAVRGAPLRAAVYAQGKGEPVLELKATSVSYDAVPESDVAVSPPTGAKVTDFSPDEDHAKAAGTRREHGKLGAHDSADSITGPAAVQRALDFDLAAPATLAGLPRREVRLVSLDGRKGALAVYGEGFGAIAVLQHKVDTTKQAGRQGRGERDLRLPAINIDGATGSELATALGTLVTFERGGVSYVVAGSVAPVAAENAARGLK